ncbi:MAG TPA: hypothetical protein VLI90_13235, partial [Tepidisphaeraceae bacterium]|nr:hypothetical protein [Tepidisphaeraceae bacterium]
SACPNGSICVWNMSAVPSGAPRLLHRFKHGGEVRAIAFSPDGRLLLAGGGDNTAQFWDVASGDPVGPPMRHDGAVIAVGFDPVNHLALTASEDGALRLWPIAPTAETAADVTRWAETTTGMTSDAASNTRWLTVAEWWERTRSVSISRR